MPLLIATRNQGKIRELRALLADLPFKLVGLEDFGPVTDIAEIGATFAENAGLKASGYALQTGLMTLSDDSGLEVEALEGRPGVRSARYLGDDVPYSVRNERLLAEIKESGNDNSQARFVSVIAIADACGAVLNSSTGICEGIIASAPRGTGGFGYDPIFIPNGYDRTLAELGDPAKNKISHRSQALSGAREFLKTLTAASDGR